MLGHRTGWAARARLAAGVVALGTLVAGTTAVGASAAAAPAAAPASAPAASHSPARKLVVATADGRLRGMAVGTVHEFLGVPYAAPPVGRLRWRAPHPAAHWKGVRSARPVGAHGPQGGGAFGVASTTENCLFQNVYTPSHINRALPVMVWIHGGALVNGESNDYNPAKLVKDGTIVVTINYRLGALGFLAHPALASRKGGPSGNYGLMDQQAALRWVQRNIRNFGGNRRNVTIFGESAGGLSVLSQIASPQARGLFAKAIIESGSYDLLQAPLASAETSGEAFATAVGCASQTAACLRKVPVKTILAEQNNGGYTPDVDGKVLTQSIGQALNSGKFNRVPVINGTNHDEWRLFVAITLLEGGTIDSTNYKAMIESTLGVTSTRADQIVAEYPVTNFKTAALALGAVGTDGIFACPALTIDKVMSKFVPTFGYEFNDEHAPERFLPPIPGFPYGAPHASELQYLFTLGNPPAGTFTVKQQKLAASMKRYWTNFAKRGFPSSAGEPLWTRFRTATHRIQSMFPARPRVEKNFSAEHHCGFWDGTG